jgi:hypothetical protein
VVVVACPSVVDPLVETVLEPLVATPECPLALASLSSKYFNSKNKTILLDKLRRGRPKKSLASPLNPRKILLHLHDDGERRFFF